MKHLICLSMISCVLFLPLHGMQILKDFNQSSWCTKLAVGTSVISIIFAIRYAAELGFISLFIPDKTNENGTNPRVVYFEKSYAKLSRSECQAINRLCGNNPYGLNPQIYSEYRINELSRNAKWYTLAIPVTGVLTMASAYFDYSRK